MPQLKPLTREENRERLYMLTQIRKLRRMNPEQAERDMTEYRKRYWTLPPGPRGRKAKEAKRIIAEDESRSV